MQDLSVTIVQADLAWEDPDANRTKLSGELARCASSDVVVLPEMFTTGFSVASVNGAETMDGPTIDWMRRESERHDIALTGSVKIRADGNFYNRMLWATPDGSITGYDKRHLFRMAGEQKRYRAGASRVIVGYRGWRLLLQVCYDLRFPVFSRSRNDYDVVIYVANWPAARRGAWTRLLPARAIENLAYCVGVNRTGRDGNEIDYAGDSAILDFKGEALVILGDVPESASAVLSAGALARFREKFPAHLDADAFEIDY